MLDVKRDEEERDAYEQRLVFEEKERLRHQVNELQLELTVYKKVLELLQEAGHVEPGRVQQATQLVKQFYT